MANLKSQGAGIFVSDAASPEVFTEIAQVKTVAGPTGSATEIDVTALDSAAAEFLMGLPNEGTVTIGCLHDPDDTQHELLRANRVAQTSTNFQIKMTNSPQTVYSFAAYITNFELDMGVDSAIMASYTLRINGSVTKS